MCEGAECSSGLVYLYGSRVGYVCGRSVLVGEFGVWLMENRCDSVGGGDM